MAGDGTLRWLKMLTLTLGALISVPACWLGERCERSGKCTPTRHLCRLVAVWPAGEVSYRYIQWAFNRFIVRARQRYGRLVYFRVVEEQRRGAPHLHLLVACRAFLPQRELSRLAVAAGLGPVVHILAVRSIGRSASYVAKYATKLDGADVPRGFHFYTRSQLWGRVARVAHRLRMAKWREGSTFAYVKWRDAGVVAAGLGLVVDPGGQWTAAP